MRRITRYLACLLLSAGSVSSIQAQTPPPDRSAFLTIYREPRNFSIEATNPGGHSSTPVRENAIYELAEGLIRLRDLQFPVHMNPVTRTYFEKMGALQQDSLGVAMRELAKDPTNESAPAIVSTDRAFNSMLRTTCVATLLTAGHAINWG